MHAITVCVEGYHWWSIKFDELSNFEWSCPTCVHFEHTQIEDRQHQIRDHNLVEVGPKGGPARAYSDRYSILRRRGIKVAHINVNGLISKLTQIEMLLKDCNIDVLAVTATHLTNPRGGGGGGRHSFEKILAGMPVLLFWV